jgi:hypothetical protein
MFICNGNLNGWTDDFYYSLQKFNDWTTPDIGFPDRRLWIELSNTYPLEKWTREKVSDIYRYYEIGVSNHNVAPFNLNTRKRDIFAFIKNNSSYPAFHIDHFAEMFEKGASEGWIDPKYLNAGKAPSQISEIATAVTGGASSAVSKLTLLLGVSAGLYAMYLLTPIAKRALK